MNRVPVSRSVIRAELALRFPKLAARRKPKDQPPADTRAISLGRNQAGEAVLLSERPRLEHAHVIGTTGGGKTNFLEHMIRQDISDGRGVCVVDPHGNHPDSLYRSLLGWLHAKGFTATRIIHL